MFVVVAHHHRADASRGRIVDPFSFGVVDPFVLVPILILIDDGERFPLLITLPIGPPEQPGEDEVE